jgi:hypothetical protein
MSFASPRGLVTLVCLSTLLLVGCATVTPYDYTAFHRSPPRSILILPPIDESTTANGSYSYLSTVSQAVAERGYYVFPVDVVDRMMQENGLPTPGDMHQTSLAKVREITGADAVLYLVLKEYGSHYQLLASKTRVRVSARLVDAHTQSLLWENTAQAESSNGNSSAGLLASIVAAAIAQIINSKVDPARALSRVANKTLFEQKTRELPYGPYHSKYVRTN